jgi:ubiquinone/menaquinone biosynthesis C-methylase UbiE
MQFFEECWQKLRHLKTFNFQLDAVPRDYYLRIVQEHAPETFLDVGCGTGLTYKVLLESNLDPLYVGLDITPRFIKLLKKKYPEAQWHVGRAQNLPFPDRSFDMVTCRALLEHLPDPAPAIREMARVAKDTVVIVWHLDPKPRETLRFLEKQQVHNNTYSRKRIWDILEELDLSIVDTLVQQHREHKRTHTIWVLKHGK